MNVEDKLPSSLENSWISHFRENMAAMGMPAPDSLFTSVTAALAEARTLWEVARWNPNASMTEILRYGQVSQRFVAAGGVTAAAYLGVVIGSIAQATVTWLNDGQSLGSMIYDGLNTPANVRTISLYVDGVLVESKTYEEDSGGGGDEGSTASTEFKVIVDTYGEFGGGPWVDQLRNLPGIVDFSPDYRDPRSQEDVDSASIIDSSASDAGGGTRSAEDGAADAPVGFLNRQGMIGDSSGIELESSPVALVEENFDVQSLSQLLVDSMAAFAPAILSCEYRSDLERHQLAIASPL